LICSRYFMGVVSTRTRGSVVHFSVWAMLYAHALYEYRGDGRLRATTMSVISISGHGWYFPPKRSARAAARAAMMVSASATGSSSEVWVAPRGSSGRKFWWPVATMFWKSITTATRHFGACEV